MAADRGIELRPSGLQDKHVEALLALAKLRSGTGLHLENGHEMNGVML